MNRFVLGAFLVFLTSRLFSETLGILPKWTDLSDLVFIPLFVIMGFAGRLDRSVDRRLHGKMLTLVTLFSALCVVSFAMNVDRSHWPIALLYMFGMLEGPLLYISLNRIIRDKRKFATQAARFIYLLLLIEAGVVIFINLPIFLATGNPDAMSGTFGNNCYQFSALLIIMGGFFLGMQKVSGKSKLLAFAIQGAVFITFLLLQYRTATIPFFLSYLVLLFVLYGKYALRLVSIGAVLAVFGFVAFTFVLQNFATLKFSDLGEIFEDPAVLSESGRLVAYANTFAMYGEYPHMMLVGAGPGNFSSRANNMFTYEMKPNAAKGIGPIIAQVFGAKDYYSDVQRKYIVPIFDLGAKFGSVQFNNPFSSILSALAELGIPGLIIVLAMYGTVTRRSIGYLKYALNNEDRLLIPFASALFIGSLYLMLLTPLDNYLEISRVVLPIWLLFWTVSTLTKHSKEAREQERLEQLAIARHLMPAPVLTTS